ncbi:MAG: hypothetical protein A3F70_18145 [Acidobacteria bacterium RIFCSPLOWO2_12_FULL_67_14]|nr:MAG: hypothetical protein A3F70_18145 [Acidobacteria bacterium RIFCSPLOWO2_12_FULL_67_14]
MTATVLIATIVPRVDVLAQDSSQPASTATYAETIDWIKSRIAGEESDSTGIRILRTIEVEGCRVDLRRYAGRLPLVSGVFNLKDIAYIDLVDQPVGTLWTGVFLVFKTSNGEARISSGRVSSDSGQLVQRQSPLFEWHLGSVHPGDTSDLRELGNRLHDAFGHAITLCGGALKKEPF